MPRETPALLLTNTAGDPPRESETVDPVARTAEDLAPAVSEEYGDETLRNHFT